MRVFGLYTLIVLLTATAAAQQPKLSARADSSSYKIGEWILLHVEAELPSGLKSFGHAVKDTIGSFEVLKIDTIGHGLDLQRQSWVFRLTTFDTGKVFIPPIPFAYQTASDTLPRIAYTNSVFLSIIGVEIDPKGDIKDIKPPLDAPWRFEDVLPYLIAVGLLAVAVLTYIYYRRRRKRHEELLAPLKPTIPPAQAAIMALRVLEEKRLWQQGRIKEYYSEVTEIVRRFLEDQFGILALESTSEEILRQLRYISQAEPVLRQSRSFFTTADLVKFAKYEPAMAEHENELRWAYEIVRTMTPRVTQPAEIEEETIDVR